MESVDIQAVQSVVTGILHAIDLRHWTALASLFSTEVTTDYTSLFGGEVQRQGRDQLIGGWRQMLSPLDATQHVLGPIVVTGDATRAVAECHVRGYHIWDKAQGGREWMVAGHYVFELQATDRVWRVSKLTIHTLCQSGNRDLLRQVSQ